MKENKVGRPKSEKPKGYNLVTRLDEETLELLDKHCKKEKLNRSELVRKLIKEYK